MRILYGGVREPRFVFLNKGQTPLDYLFESVDLCALEQSLCDRAGHYEAGRLIKKAISLVSRFHEY